MAVGPLGAFLGANTPVALNARGITAMLETPGCVRRAVFDSTVGLDSLTRILDLPPGEQAQHAFARGNSFEHHVMANGASELLPILRSQLNLPVAQVRFEDLSATKVRENLGAVPNLNATRVRLTNDLLRAMLSGTPGAPTIIRHGLTMLTIGSRTAYLEQDALALVVGGLLHIIEVKSFPFLDGRADPGKADAAGRQSAVYAMSLQQTLAGLGLNPATVSTTSLLVLPQNFSLTPVGHLLPLETRIRRLTRQLQTLPDDAALAAVLPPGLALPTLPVVTNTADPVKRRAQDIEIAKVAPAVSAAFDALPPTFGDACLSCPAFLRCRDEAARTGAVASLGSTAASACGSVGHIPTALALAEGTRTPGDEAEIALAAALARAQASRSRRVS
ncbi:hypothetical protein ACI799_01535 [Blastococcus sp. SYSU DS0753]